METRNTRMNRKNEKKQMSLRVIAIAALTILLGLVTYFKIKPPIKPEQQLNVPIENQMPDLPNGCEVTSLAMLLNYYGIKVTKEDLAQKIAHVSSYDGNYRGNPNKGFVGYMSQKNGGWCVYSEPLFNVAQKYTDRIQNATGDSFEQIIQLVSSGHPVLIITTLNYKPVHDMQTWHTRDGIVHVTPSSHACVITGYNNNKRTVTVNDPYGVKNKIVSWSGIEKSYVQQGKQALFIS